MQPRCDVDRSTSLTHAQLWVSDTVAAAERDICKADTLESWDILHTYSGADHTSMKNPATSGLGLTSQCHWGFAHTLHYFFRLVCFWSPCSALDSQRCV